MHKIQHSRVCPAALCTHPSILYLPCSGLTSMKSTVYNIHHNYSLASISIKSTVYNIHHNYSLASISMKSTVYNIHHNYSLASISMKSKVYNIHIIIIATTSTTLRA